MSSDDWPEVRLGDLGRIVTGRTPPGTRSEYFGGEIPFITPTDMTGGRQVESPGRCLSSEGAGVLKSVLVPRGVAVSCIGWQMGKSLLVTQRSATNQQINTIVPTESLVDLEFLYYALSAKRSEIFALGAGGSRTPILNKSGFANVRLRLPPLPAQHRIAGILASLDDKIDLNRRMNRTLESIVRAIFKSWFVDFDPVRKQAKGGEAGLPPGLAALFPKSLVSTRVGFVPEAWHLGRCDEDFRITMGQSPPGDTYNGRGDGMPFYQGRRDFGPRYPARRVYCTAPSRLARAGDTLVSVRAPVGAVNVAQEDCCIGRGLAAVRHTSGAIAYTIEMMRSLKAVFDDYEAGGTVFGSIGGADFKALPVVIPPRAVVEQFESLMSPCSELQGRLHVESHSLAGARDRLQGRFFGC